MPTKPELEKVVEELQQRLEAAAQSKEATEAAVKAATTVEFHKEIAGAIEAEKKRTELVKQELLVLQRTAEDLKRDSELAIMRAKDTLRDNLARAHSHELQMREELAHVQKERGEERIQTLECQLADKESKIAELEAAISESSDGGGGDLLLSTSDSVGEGHPSVAPRRLSLPSVPEFNGEKLDDEEAFNRWIKKLKKHAEICRWSVREKLLQFELHLVGRAEAVYETLPAEVKGSFTTAVEALRKRLQPPKRDALRLAQLIKRKQQSDEHVDKYAQDFEALVDKSYGNREGMDQASKDMLKRDLFVQGLLWKWQEKVLPSSANTFDDALYQARIAEE